MPSKKHVPIIGDLMVSRWAYEALAVDQFSNNRFERVFFEDEKEKSRQQFKSAFLISELSNKIIRSELELKSKKNSNSFGKEMGLIANELKSLSKDPATKKIKAPDISKLNENAGLREIETVKQYLDTLKSTFSRLAAEAGKSRDKKYKDMVAEMGSDEVFQLQQEYYNKSLANIVMNKMQLKKIIEIDGELIQKKDPIFMKPNSNYGRAQFYTSEKMLFGYTINTYWFNILVIWFGTFIMYIALLKDWLKKVFVYFENIKIRKRSKE